MSASAACTTADIVGCIAEHVATRDAPHFRRVCRTWCDAFDARVRAEEEDGCRTYLNAMRVRCIRRVPMRYLLMRRNEYRHATPTWVCARCGKPYRGTFMSCPCATHDYKTAVRLVQTGVAVLVVVGVVSASTLQRGATLKR